MLRAADSDVFSWWSSKSSNTLLVSKPASWSASCVSLPSDADKVRPCLPVVALGGTFDHLHAGHKILLSMAAWISRKKLIVGVTGSELSFLIPYRWALLHLTLTLMIIIRRQSTREQGKQTRPRNTAIPDRPCTVFPHFFRAKFGVRYRPDSRRLRTDSSRPGHPGVGDQ